MAQQRRASTMTGSADSKVRQSSQHYTSNWRLSASGDRQKGLRTLSWNEIEPWQQDNHFIIRGYRAATSSYRKSIQSLMHVHNQTVNIWSHLLGAIAFSCSAILLHHHHNEQISEESIAAKKTSPDHSHDRRAIPQFDLLLFGQFYAGLLICLTLSSAFHTFGNHSEVVRDCFLLGDLAGIILLTMSSFYPGVYYGFYCEPQIARFYCVMVSAFLLLIIPSRN